MGRADDTHRLQRHAHPATPRRDGIKLSQRRASPTRKVHQQRTLAATSATTVLADLVGPETRTRTTPSTTTRCSYPILANRHRDSTGGPRQNFRPTRQPGSIDAGAHTQGGRRIPRRPSGSPSTTPGPHGRACATTLIRDGSPRPELGSSASARLWFDARDGGDERPDERRQTITDPGRGPYSAVMFVSGSGCETT